jgi:hypothetical protein
LYEEFLYFQGQTTNACAFLLINGSLNEDKELNLTTNHRSPRAKRFANYALKTGMEGVLQFLDYSIFHQDIQRLMPRTLLSICSIIAK